MFVFYQLCILSLKNKNLLQNSMENLEMNNVEAESTVEVGLLLKPLPDFFKCLTNTEASCIQCKKGLSFQQKQHQI